MLRRKPKCQWAGHGTSHIGDGVIELTLGRPCGHQTQGPILTCVEQANIILADGGKSPVKTICPECGVVSSLRVVDPEVHGSSHSP